MKKFAAAVAAISIAALFSSCSLTLPICATSNPVGSKVGEATTAMVFGFFFDGGDASIATAAKKGGIKNISTVDFKRTWGFANTFTTIVTGE